MVRLSLIALTLGALALPSGAQIMHRNASYVWTLPTLTQSDSIDPSFTAHAEQAADVLFEQWWAYRVDNDPDETYFTAQNLTVAWSGSHADFDWSDIDGRGLLSAKLDLDVRSTGHYSGRLSSRLEITNIGAAPLTLNLFHYVDIDMCSAVPNFADGTGFEHEATGPFCGTDSVRVTARNADLWRVAPFSVDECGIGLPGPATLTNGALPFAAGDYASAFQWQNRVLAPGESMVAMVGLCHNPPLCPDRAGVWSFGTPAPPHPTFGTLSFDSTVPVIGVDAILSWDNAVPSASGVLLVGDAIPPFPLQNLELFLAPAFTVPLQADGAGAATLTLPLVDPGVCGTVVSFQALFVDNTATPLPLRHTAAISWLFGR